MNKPLLTAKSVFDRAYEIPAPEERRAYLDEACGDDAELRGKVEALLRAYDEAGSFLDKPAAAPQGTSDVAPRQWLDADRLPETPLEGVGSRIKQYKLLQQIIREEEPPRPSTRLSETKDSLASVSAQRRTEPAGLVKAVRSEVDWMVMKALDKDRTRRYETANGLARDIARYLAEEPVEAGPPSARYRLRKLAWKHRRGLATAAALLLLLVAGVVVSTTLAVWAMRAEKQALAERNRALTAEAEATAHRDEAQTAHKATQKERNRAVKAEKETKQSEADTKAVKDASKK